MSPIGGIWDRNPLTLRHFLTFTEHRLWGGQVPGGTKTITPEDGASWQIPIASRQAQLPDHRLRDGNSAGKGDIPSAVVGHPS